MSTTLATLDLGAAVGRPAFRNFSVVQLRNGEYVVTVTYVLQTLVNGEIVAESEVVNRTLSDSEIRSHPDFAALYPAVQTFTRSVLAEARPDLVTPA